MKPQREIIRQTRNIALGIAVMDAIMLIVFALIGCLDGKAVLGALYGSVLAVANFFFLGMTVQKIAETANVEDADEIKLAKLRMRRSYMLRMLALVVLLILALEVFKLNWIACFLPLLFGRISIFIANAGSKVKSVKGSDIK